MVIELDGMIKYIFRFQRSVRKQKEHLFKDAIANNYFILYTVWENEFTKGGV